MAWIEKHWYRHSWLSLLLLPVAAIYCSLVALRRSLYRIGVLSAHRIPVPVIVVGNISTGGTGKTPLVIWLANRLAATGKRPGIVLRGYGGRAADYPVLVSPDQDAATVGDEALVLACRTQCSVVVDPNRVRGAQALVERHGCDVVLSDDGLQHYALDRDVEIAVIDGERRMGNGFCLPAGPLREPESRLQEVHLRVTNGEPAVNEYRMTVQPIGFRALHEGEPEQPLTRFKGQSVHAVAGIGNPRRFFDLLRSLGIVVYEHVFPDHYQFQGNEIAFGDGQPVIMTEKDAVKCRRIGNVRAWYLAIDADVDGAVFTAVQSFLNEKISNPGKRHG